MYLTLTTHNSFAQNVGISATGATPNASSIIDLNTGNTFTSPNGKGILPPNVALTSITDAVTITSPATSLWVYNTATAGAGTAAVVPGYYYWDGAKWVRLQTTASTAPDWSLLGNAGTTAGANFIGTTDGQDVVFKTNSIEQVRVVSTTSNVGIGNPTPNASAKVDITSITQGFAMPRHTTAQRLAIVSPIDGLQVYDTNLKGFYYFNTTTNKWDCVSNPAGTVQYFANTLTPVGYLACNGQTVTTTTYPELFNAIGYTYGGSGTTFNVPDLRGEFIRGLDAGRGVDPARVIGSPQVDNFKSHTHLSNVDAPDLGLASSYDSVTLGRIAPYTRTPTNVGNTGGTETRPRNIALMPCIKY